MSEKRLPGIKQGTNFAFYADYSFNSIAESFPATDLTAQVRDGDDLLLAQMTVAADPLVVGRFNFSATAAQTLSWPIGDVYFDIKRTSGGVTTKTDTVVVAVAQRVTA